jgi:hypothetical protein
MPDMDEPSLTPAEQFDRYQFIRSEIQHEDNLIGTRLSWFTASQAFLLTALAIAQGPQHGLPNARLNYFFPLLPLVAIASDVLIFVGVLAGIDALRRWRRMLEVHMPEESAALPCIRNDGWIIRFGWSAPLGLPLVFLAAWVYLLFAGLAAA